MSIGRILICLIIGVCMCLAFAQGGFWGCLGIAAVGFVLYDFFIQEKSWLPVGEMALLLGGIQWIISPFFAYSIDNVYKMSQPCEVYMMYTVTMYIAFMVGFYYFRTVVSLKKEELIKLCGSACKISNVLITIGVICLFVPVHAPALLFIKSLASHLFFIGFIIRMFMNPQRSSVYLFISLGVQLFHSIRGGMFHELLVWGMFMIIIWFYINQTSLKKRISIFAIALVGVFLLQTVKSTFRQAVWQENYSKNKVELFFSLLLNNAININEVKQENNETTIARYNQGWIISRIYNNIPQHHDYFKGKTYLDAVTSAILPRFLFPDKKGAGAQSRQDFIEMTGYQLSKGASMGLSILGESYGNFGWFGGILFMFLWGCLIAKCIAFIDFLSRRNYLWIMFLPVICFNLIKAEISMMSVLNWTVKSIIFVLIVLYLLRLFALQTKFSDNDCLD